jgi:hypothetical protein
MNIANSDKRVFRNVMRRRAESECVKSMKRVARTLGARLYPFIERHPLGVLGAITDARVTRTKLNLFGEPPLAHAVPLIAEGTCNDPLSPSIVAETR